jgi:hypothetical protein
MSLKTPPHPAMKPKRPRRQVKARAGASSPSVDPNENAVPFKVTAFAAAVFQPPAISDAVEEEPVFDKSKAKRVAKKKKSPAI